MSSPGDKAKKNKIYRQLQDLIEKESSKASFACGGSISISKSATAKAKAQAQCSAPINLFWASATDDAVHKLTLPESSTESSVEQLAKDCTVASFGRGGQDVVDTAYRQAGKLDITQFASTFHPADFGLLENIEQILVPDMGKKPKDDTHSRKLIAERYKLNDRQVISVPMSILQGAEVRSDRLLSVCQLHFKGETFSFAMWAAFYSDCEHEIKNVTEGHRVTLTYNLHLVDVVGGAIRLPKRIVDPDSLPPYDLIRSMMEQSQFMAEGGTLGIHCSHAYAHTSQDAAKAFPRNLKGSDLVIYSIFQSLGVEVSVRPVLQNPVDWDYYYEALNYNEESGDESESDTQKRGTRQDKKKAKKEEKMRSKSFVGTKLHPHGNYDSYDLTPEEELKEISRSWPNDQIGDIVWLTSPKHSKTALTYLAYGNEASIDYKYSCAAILVTIPHGKIGKAKVQNVLVLGNKR